MIHIDMLLLSFISGTVIPLVTALITRYNAPAGVKAFLSALLAAITAVVAYATEFAGVVQWQHALVVFFATWVTHAASYFGFWKPTDVAPAIQRSTSSVGIG